MTRPIVMRWLIGLLCVIALGLAGVAPTLALADEAGAVALDSEETCPRKISVW